MYRGFLVWKRTPFLAGCETPRPGPVRVCVCSSFLAGSGEPASQARFCAPHLSFGRFFFLLCSAPSGLGLPCCCSFVCLLSACLVPFACLRCLLLFLVSGPGCPGPWRFVFLSSLPFLGFFFSCLRPRCLWPSLVSGHGCPGPWRCLLFVLLVSRFSALPGLSLLLRFPPGRWLLPGGCCPPPPFVSRVFLAAARPPPLFFLFPLLLCSCLLVLSLVGGSRRPLPPPPTPLVCSVGLPLLSSPFALSAFLFPACSLVVAAPPPPPLCLAVFVAAARCPPNFFSAALPLPTRLVLVSGTRRRPSPPRPVLLFGLLVSRCSALCALPVLLCFPPGRWLLPFGCCPPLPSLFRGFRRRCWPLRFLFSFFLPFVFFSFFVCCFAPACLLGARACRAAVPRLAVL